jgi:hypothetical protein
MARWGVLLPTFDPLRRGAAPVAAGVCELVVMPLGRYEPLSDVRDRPAPAARPTTTTLRGAHP